ncbi:MAG: hypothetical protein JXA09_14625 [Anaerolineae bacterium]|nr:hypothetical protein [Anaerolineae bacterium]
MEPHERPIEAQIEDLQQRLQDARDRIPKHTPPPALMAQIDELEVELACLQAQREAAARASRIAELEARLQDARDRIPKHSTSPALIAQIDELEEELARLRGD